MKFRASSWQILLPMSAVAMRVASAPTANLSYIVIAAYALLGRAQAIQAMGLCWLFGLLSSGIFPQATEASTARYVVFAAAAVSVFLRSGMFVRGVRVSPPVLGTVLLGLFLVVHSFVFSLVKDVSVLKALSWTVVASTLIAAWAGLTLVDRERLAGRIFGGLIVILICSLPLLASPLGYLRNNTGFQGVLDHPQAFGPAMGLLGVWAGGRVLAEAKPAWGVVALFGACVVLVVLSEARTAGVAGFLGLLIAGLAGQALTGRTLRGFLPGLRSPRVHLVASLALIMVVLAGSTLSNRVGQFITKRSGSGSLTAAYDVSRGAVIEEMWANIQAKPLQGIGLGIASDPSTMVVDRDPLLGLPTGASVEKGVLPVAVLEELGVFGFLAVILWLWMLVRRAARGKGMITLGVFLTILLMNMAEAVLFSPGGMGLLSLLLIGWVVSYRRDEAAAPNA